MSEPEEAELVSRARSGDADAFADLCQPHSRRAFNLALRLCGDRDQAQDICQDALLRAFRSLTRFRGEAAFGTWLLAIVHNACLDAIRRRRRRPEVPLDEEGSPPQAVSPGDPTADPESAALARERQRLILAALANLRPEFRAAVVLRDVQGLPYEEAAAVAGVPVGTLKSRLHRGRAELRDALRAVGLVPASGRTIGTEGPQSDRPVPG